MKKEELIKNFLFPLRTELSSVLIFSDAGAARGGYSKERVELTKKFLDKLNLLLLIFSLFEIILVL